MARSPAYRQHPEHRVEVQPHHLRVRVGFAGVTVADSARSLRVLESRHDPVVYVPREDVRQELLERTEHSTFCPFKGRASYYSIRVGDRVAENAIWSYEDPYDEVAPLRGCMAFYLDRVDSLSES